MRFTDLVENLNWAVGHNLDKADGWSNKDQANPDNAIIWVNIRNLMNAVSDDFRLDLDDELGGGNSIKGRVVKAIEHFKSGGYMNPSMISLGYRGIDFTDGRHRLVAAYRLGEKTAPVIVPKEQADEIVELLK